MKEGGHSIALDEDRCVWYRNREEKIKAFHGSDHELEFSILMKEMREPKMRAKKEGGPSTNKSTTAGDKRR